MKGQGWTVQYLKSSSYRTLEKLPLHAGRGALLVADYAQAYVGVIGRWLEELEGQRRSTPLRVLLIERDGQSCEESSWGSQLQGAMQRSRIAKALCYREPFLALQPLQEAELQTILQNYIEAWGKAWKPEEIQSLLQALQTVDPELQRPLYALFVADAWVQERTPPSGTGNKSFSMCWTGSRTTLTAKSASWQAAKISACALRCGKSRR